MSQSLALVVLFLAAVLEAGGDALVRTGLEAGSAGRKIALLAAGAVVLFAYGCAVNAPHWDFGKLLGIYVVFFFVAAQAISWAAFGRKPSLPILVGGAFVVLGGLIISLWQP